MPSRASNSTGNAPRGGGGGGRRRKGGTNEPGAGGGGGAAAAPDEPAADGRHNSDFPCSDHLRCIALRIIRDGGAGGGCPSLNRLITDQVSVVLSHQPAGGGGSSNRKKRKKKKKKKNRSNKAQQEEEVAAATSASVDEEERGDDDDENRGPAATAAAGTPSPSAPRAAHSDSAFGASAEAEPSAGACPLSTQPPAPPATPSPPRAEQAATTTAAAPASAASTPTREGHHRNPSQQQSNVVDNPHWAFLREFLSRYCEIHKGEEGGGSNGGTSGSSSHNLSSTASSFWSRILSQTQTCYISMKRVKSYTSQIKCGICRASVESILEVENELVLSSTIPTKLRLPSKSKDGDEHAFDYVAMEEGNGPGFAMDDKGNKKPTIPNDALVFALTTEGSPSSSGGGGSHDKNSISKNNSAAKAWKLRFHSSNEENERKQQQQLTPLSQQNLTHNILMNYIFGHALSYEDMVAEIAMLPPPSSSSTGTKKNDTQSLQRKVQKTLAMKGFNFVNECTQELLKLSSKFSQVNVDAVSDNNVGNTADITTFGSLQEIDGGCTAMIVERLFDSAWQTTMQFLTSSNNTAFGSSLFEKTMKETLLQNIWANYLNVIGTITNSISKYEEDLEQKVAHPHTGTLPAVFFSRTYRQLYRNLVQTKLKWTLALIQKLDGAFQRPVETGWPAFEMGTKEKACTSSSSSTGTGTACAGGKGSSEDSSSSSPFFTTFQRRLLTQQAYYEKQIEGRKVAPASDYNVPHNKDQQEQEQDYWKPTVDVLPQDAAVLDYMKAVNEQLETINRGSINPIQEERRLRNERIQRRLDVVLEKFEGMVNEIVTIPTTPSSSSLVEGLAFLRELSATTAKLPASSRDKGDAAPTISIASLTYNLIRYWIALRCQYKAATVQLSVPSGTESNESDEPMMKLPPFLPTTVIKTLAESRPTITNNLYQVTEQEEADDEDDDYGHLCSAYNGNEDSAVANAKERAVCILVCAYYQWMVEKYNEWRAEMAEQELMELEQQDSTQQERGASAIVDDTNGSKGKQGNKKSKKKSKDKNKGTNLSLKNGGSATTESNVSISRDPQEPRSEEEKIEINEGGKQPQTEAHDNPKEEEAAAAATNTDTPVSSVVTDLPLPESTKHGEREPSLKRVRQNIGNNKGTNALIQQSGSFTNVLAGGKLPPPPGIEMNNNRAETIPPKAQQSQQVGEKYGEAVSEIDSFVTIGVHDYRNNFFPAEEFLSARLVAVLNDETET